MFYQCSSKFFLLILSFSIIVLCFVANLAPEEPPHLSQKWLKNAQEKIEIQVDKVAIKDVSDGKYLRKLVNVKATILSVKESKSQLKIRSAIYIVYLHRYDNMPGPSSIPILVKKNRYFAYLNKLKNKLHKKDMIMSGWDSSNQFRPAALGKSFKEITAKK